MAQSDVEAVGASCLACCGSVSDEAFVQTVFQQAQAQFGRIDVVVNNAGFGIFKPAAEITADEWDQIFATNAKGTFLVSKAAIPFMKAQGAGHIINIASDVAKRTFANGSLYCASKYAQDAFSMALRKEVRSLGIKVSVVYSGLVDSYFHADPQGDASHETWLKNEDMANAISFIIEQPAHVVIDELMIHPLSQDY
jgi:NADP-dependent 3-hydroxy acid dehydrogenase YdfG